MINSRKEGEEEKITEEGKIEVDLREEGEKGEEKEVREKREKGRDK